MPFLSRFIIFMAMPVLAAVGFTMLIVASLMHMGTPGWFSFCLGMATSIGSTLGFFALLDQLTVK